MIRETLFLFAFLTFAAAHAATPLKDAKLTGTTSVPAGSTLDVDAAATVKGLERAGAADAAKTSAINTARIYTDTAFLKAAKAPVVAVFTISLGGAFTDFELKGTLSNFGEHSPFTDLYLYYHSSDPARTAITSQTGPKPTVFFTDSGWVDHRRWRKQSAAQSIWQMRSRSTAIIPAAIVIVPIDATITPANANLVWSYCRINATDYERDSTGSTIWHPIIPTWSTIAPTP